MKKLFAFMALIGILASCNNKKNEEKKTDEPTTISPTIPNETPATTAASGVPTFSDPDVQTYVNDYTAFVNAYVEAYKTKDMTKIAEMGPKMTDWTSRSMSLIQKLAGNPDDLTKFSDYTSKLSEQLAAAMQME